MVLPLVKNKVEGSCGFKTQGVFVQLAKKYGVCNYIDDAKKEIFTEKPNN
jgi:hypothetical protein